MSRLETMSRFAEPDDKLPLSYCSYCEEDLYRGDTVIALDHENYCSAQCLAVAIAIIKPLGDD